MAKLRFSKVTGRTAGTLLLGNMYMFEYLAERTNVYFDAFPLVFVLKRKRTSEGGLKYFEGLNFHILSVERRLALFKMMDRFFSTEIFDDRGNMVKEIQEDTFLLAREFRRFILVSKKFRDAKVAIRRYNFSNVQTQLLKVHPKDWLTVLQETPERFFTGSYGKVKGIKVWRESFIRSRSV